MTTLQLLPIYQLHLFGVFDAGVPNREYVAIRPTQRVNLAEFCLTLGLKTSENSVAPLPDHFLWFGNRIVEPPYWILVYTGKGLASDVTFANGERGFKYYWNKPITLFSIPDVVPVLFHMDSVATGSIPPGLGFSGAKKIESTANVNLSRP